MKDTIHIYDILTPEEAAEHRRLAKLHRIQELKTRNAPLTLAELAEVMELSPERVRQIQRLAEHKAKKAILNTYPEIITNH